MFKKRLFEIIINIIQRLQSPYYRGVAAELAFYFMLSLTPLILILTQILGFFHISLTRLQEMLYQYLPPEAASSLMNILPNTRTGNVSFSIFSGFVALWAASKAQFSLMRICNFTFNGKLSVKNFFRERFIAIKTLLITLFTFLFSFFILMYGEIIINAISAYVNGFIGQKFQVSYAWFVLRWVLATGVYFFMVSYIYYVLPTIRVKFTSLLPGSIVASTGMLILTFIYSTFAIRFSSYDLLYGSFAAIISMLVWFWFIGWILVIGILFNAAWDETGKHIVVQNFAEN